MSKILKNLFFILLFLGIFIYVILKVPYPTTLFSANFFQISSFFIPLFILLTFIFNVFLKNTPVSLSVSLGIILLLVLRGLDILNLITGGLILLVVYLLVSYFQKMKRKNLTKLPKIPKLTQFGREK